MAALALSQIDELRTQLQRAVIDCNDRCLYQAAKWWVSTLQYASIGTDVFQSGQRNCSTRSPRKIFLAAQQVLDQVMIVMPLEPEMPKKHQ